MGTTRTSRRMVTTALVVVALSTAACGGPNVSPSEPEPDSSSPGTEVTERFSAEDVAELGDVTLSLLLDAGEEGTIEELVPRFEEKYPNVTVDVTYRSWNDLMSTVVSSTTGSEPPDIFNAGSGYAVMPRLLQAGAVRPIDDLRQAYGWDENVSDNALAPHFWESDGSQYGTGELYGFGIAPQYIGIFYNKSTLADLGIEVPSTIDELDRAMAEVADAGEQPVMVGNADQYPIGSHILGLLVAMYQSVSTTNAWLSGTEGATFDTPEARMAVEHLKRWGEAGYFGEGYNGVSLDDAVSRFANGEGAFFIAGNFIGASIAEVDADNFGFFALQRNDGTYAAPGGLGTSYRLSAHTTVLPAVAEFIDMLKSPEFAQVLVDNQRIPLSGQDSVESPNPLHADMMEAGRLILGSEGTTEQLDNASETMQRTLGVQTQQLLDGRTEVDGLIEAVQADYDAFQKERRSDQ